MSSNERIVPGSSETYASRAAFYRGENPPPANHNWASRALAGRPKPQKPSPRNNNWASMALAARPARLESRNNNRASMALARPNPPSINLAPMMCVHCKIRPPNLTFLPCGHKLYCDQCWGVKVSLNNCLCGANIESVIFDYSYMSGKWTGFSKPADASKPRTEWANTIIHFIAKPEDPTIFDISGRGSSLFQGEEIHFHLVGTVDARAKTFELFKTHTGRFVHTLVYRGNIDPDKQILSGSFAGGTLELRKINENARLGGSRKTRQKSRRKSHRKTHRKYRR